MVTNVTAEYLKAEKKYLEAKTDEEKLKALEEMLRCVPKHKGTEVLIAQLKARYKKLKEKIEERKKWEKKVKKGKSFRIEKQGVQICIYGLTKAGKSLLLSLLTNAKPKISEHPFTTIMPEIGMMCYKDVDFQIVEFPSLYLILEDDRKWLSYTLTTDLILILARNLDDAKKVMDEIFAFSKQILQKDFLVIINKPNKNVGNIDNVENVGNIGNIEIKKEKHTFESSDKKIRKVITIVYCDIKRDAEIIKNEIFNSLEIYRIYLKKPTAKKPEEKPVVFLHRPSIQELLEKIKISREKLGKAMVYGKSAKFEGQAVGIDHLLCDRDVVEFYFKKV